MSFRRLVWFPSLLFLVLLGSHSVAETNRRFYTRAVARAQSASVRRVYVPYNVPGQEAALFWFGEVNPDDNYADVRMGYKDEYLYVHLNIIDRRLWYDEAPSSTTLTDWDAISLYLAPDGYAADLYRFDAQLVWWEEREPYQAAFHYDAGVWVLTTVPFTTISSWSGDVQNTNVDDRGWSLLCRVPYTSLGLAGRPAAGTVWRVAVVLHDRDTAAGLVDSTQVWPEAFVPDTLATWGELIFGLPAPYTPPPAVLGGEITIRHGLDGAIVSDADVGGSSDCGDLAGPDYFPAWGELNYAGKEFLNVQNLGYISEWPCFSKYYVTFPLTALADDAIVLSATLTLYQSGNAGEGETPGPEPSYIQVFTVAEDWDEHTITWNNAPWAGDYVTATWVTPLATAPPWPGIPRHWDVSAAVVEAHTAGTPLRLALYSPDWDFHSGKYFHSSDVAGTGEGRPTLTVAWGLPLAQVEKAAYPSEADYGETVAYTLNWQGTGATLVLTDTLPSSLTWAGDVTMSGTQVMPVYHPGQHLLTWEDAPAFGEAVTIMYIATVNTHARETIVNVVELVDQEGRRTTTTSIVIANPYRCYLPLLLKP